MQPDTSASSKRTPIVVAMMVTSLFSLPAAMSTHDNGLFELDGNALAGTAAGDDWSSLFPTNLSTTVFDSVWVAEPASNDTTYFSVSSKDIDDVDNWTVSGNSAPPKDEIHNAFAAAYNDSSRGVGLYFGADRWANNGDAAVGFWFLQNGISVDGAGNVNGTHANGDLFVVSHFTNGGSIATISVYKWNWSASTKLQLVGSGTDCASVSGSHIACGRVNSGLVPSAVPYQGSGTKDPPNQYPANSFFEGGINLTFAFDGAPPCFASFIAETRSSQETTAVLKDVAFGSLTTCPVVPPEAALTLFKAADQPVVDLGQEIGFAIILGNGGGDPAQNVLLWDELPTVSGAWTDDSPDCTITGTNLTCTYAVLPVGDFRFVNVSAGTAELSDCGPWQNIAYVTANDGQGGNYAESDPADVYVTCADVGVEKTADASPIDAGETASFTIVVTSYGPDAAENVTLADTLPAVAGSWSLGGADAASCSLTGLALSCAFGTLGAEATRTITLSTTTAFDDCGLLPNTAGVSARLDTDASNNGSSDSITVLCPDLTLDKVADDDSVSAGSAIGFTILVGNGGPGTAASVSLNDPLPGGDGIDWALDPAVQGCSITGSPPTQTLACDLGDLAAGASVEIHVTSGTSFASCAEYPNTASASADNHATIDANDTTTVLCPDLSIEKTADDVSVSAGADIGFTIAVTNDGPGTATDVTLEDALPGGDGIDWTIDPSNADCSITGATPAQTLECDFGDLADDASASVHVTSGTTFASCAAYPNTATAGASNHDDVEASDTTNVLCPDLNVVKSADDDSVSAGSPIGFTITVSNDGAGTADDVTLSDPLPGGPGIDWSIDPEQLDCSITGTPPTQTLSCDFGDLAPEASVEVHVTSSTAFASCAEYSNTATASADNHADVEASDSTTVLCPDLSIDKDADDASVSAGSPIGFTITVSNAGPGVATDATLSDALPGGDGVDWTIDPANADCSITGTAPAQTLECDFGDLADDASASVHVTSGTAFESCAEYPNAASASASNHASVEANATTTVLCPDLSVEKETDAALVDAGEDIGFTVTVSNAGPGTAADVTLSDALPDGDGIDWTIDPANEDCAITGTPPAQTLECDFGDLAAEGSASVHVTSGTSFASCAELPNTASASAGNHATVEASNSTTVQCPDLSLDKVADDASVSAGEDIGFTLTLTNDGPGTAFDVTLDDPLPGGDGIEWSIDPANEDCTITGSAPDQTLECDFGDLADGAVVGVHVASATSFASCAEYPNTGTASASNHPDVEASDTIDVLCPDLSIDKVADDETVDAGENIGFTVTVENTGDGSAFDVTLSDPLPGGSGIDWSISPSNGDCSILGSPPAQTLECDFGTLSPEESESVHVTSATAYASCAEYPNAATLAASNHADVEASDSTEVLCPDLEVEKLADDDSVSAGESIGFTITVTNDGPGTATDVTLEDELPGGDGVDWSIDPANEDCDVSGSPPSQTLECDFGDLADEESASVHVVSNTTFDSCGAYPNTATASASNHPDVEAQDGIDVLCPDVSLLKVALEATVSAGSDIGFTITVSNAGEGTAADVELDDPLPAGDGIEWSIDSSDPTCAIDGSPPTQTLECDFGDLANGESRSVSISSPTEFDSCGAYENTATASASNHPDVEASDTATVLCPDLSIEKLADDDSVSAGESIGFTIAVTNEGDGTATDVTLADTLPGGDGIEWSIDPANEDCEIAGAPPAQTLECDFGDLAPEGGAGVHVTSETTFASCAEYPNTATASASNHPDVDASDAIDVLCPDLSIDKVADDETVSAGEDVGFTITVENAGPGIAFGVTLSDPLPGGDGVDWSMDPANGDCSIAGVAPAQTLECDFGDLSAQESESVHLTSGTAFASCAEYPNTATASAENHADVEASDTTEVLCPDLSIEKTADDESVSAGEDIGFTVTVTNDGEGDAVGVTLSDPLPGGDGIDWSIDPANLDCSITGSAPEQTLECDFGTLAPEASASVHVTSGTSFASCAEYANAITASAENHPDAEASAETVVLCPDLSLEKSADAANVTAGSPIGFTLTVTNAGPGVAFDVTLEDALPGGAGTNWTIDPSGAGCAITGAAADQTLACELGDLAAQASVEIHVTSPTIAAGCGEYPNVATVGASNHASVEAQNTTIVDCPKFATRTQGFWSTHTAYTQAVFDAVLNGTMEIGDGSHVRIIDTDGKLFGAWYASVSYKTTGQKRSAVDHARMVLLQQLVTAKLNCYAFGCPNETWSLITQADIAYASANKALMANLTAQLDAYNNLGDIVALPATYGAWNPATPDVSKALANRAFWNSP